MKRSPSTGDDLSIEQAIYIYSFRAWDTIHSLSLNLILLGTDLCVVNLKPALQHAGKAVTGVYLPQ